jgi:hypothetical protein
MLPLLFELLNHLHKRPVQQGKGIKKATSVHRPLSEDLNLSKERVFFGGANCQWRFFYGQKCLYFSSFFLSQMHFLYQNIVETMVFKILTNP